MLGVFYTVTGEKFYLFMSDQFKTLVICHFY